MKLLSKLLVASMLFVVANVDASHRDEFDYIALSINKASFEEFDFTPDLDFSSIDSFGETIGSSKLAGRLFYGYQFNQFLALEAGFDYFSGKDFSVFEETSAANNSKVKTNIYTGGFKAFGGDLRVVGTYPVTNNFYIKTNVGALAWSSEVDTVSREVNGLVATTNEENGISLIAGLGLAYGIEKLVAISLDVETTEIADIRITNLGVSFTFRI